MPEVKEILNEIQERGLRAAIRDGVLFIGPSEKMTDKLRDAVKGRMAELLAHFACEGDEAVEWRTAEMLEQILPLRWPCPIPCLIARR